MSGWSCMLKLLWDVCLCKFRCDLNLFVYTSTNYFRFYMTQLNRYWYNKNNKTKSTFTLTCFFVAKTTTLYSVLFLLSEFLRNNNQRFKLHVPSGSRAFYQRWPLTSVNFYVLDTLSEKNPLGERDNEDLLHYSNLISVITLTKDKIPLIS